MTLRALRVLILGLYLVAATPVQAAQSAANTDDAVLAMRVKAALMGDETTQAGTITVDSLRGVVELSGVVPSQAAKAQAAQVAQSVKGVTAVRNKLEVRPGP